MKKIRTFLLLLLSFVFAGIAAAQETLPDLIVTSITAPASASTQEIISVSWTVKNQGNGQATVTGQWDDEMYLSTDEQLDALDTNIAYVSHWENLAAGSDYTATALAQVPNIASGNYYILAKADMSGKLSESNEENNILSKPISIGVPDLLVTSIGAPASAGTQETISINWTIKNQGNGQAIGSGGWLNGWTDKVYLSTDEQFDDLDIELTHSYRSDPLSAGSDYAASVSIKLPGVIPGSYYILVKADNDNLLYESNEANNVFSRQINVGAPDLVVSGITVPAYASTQESIDVTWIIKNQGNGQAIGEGNAQWGWANGWCDKVYLSTDEQLDALDTELPYSCRMDPLAAGSDYTASVSIQLPGVISGSYYILVKADSDNWLYEPNEENNVSSRQINIGVPDLVVTSTTAPASAATQETIQISLTVKNQGNGQAISDWRGVWNDFVYLSTDERVDVSDINIAQSAHWWESLAAGGDYTAAVSAQIPVVTSGNYYILVKTDAGNGLFESHEDNNVLVKPIAIGLPDLIVTSINAPAFAGTQETISISWTVKNQGNGQATGGFYIWNDGVYLSIDEQLDASDINIVDINHWENLAAGSEYTASASAALPNVAAGNYYLLVKTDIYEKLYESNENNNVFKGQINIGVPDLVVSGITAPATAGTQETISISWAVKNQGNGQATGGFSIWDDGVYLSTDEQLDASDITITETNHWETLAAGSEYTVTASVALPNVAAGNYYLLVKTDRYEKLYESNENNNVFKGQINIGVPDLVVSGVNAPATAGTRETISISWTVKNQGNGQATGGFSIWDDGVYLSTDEQLDASDTTIIETNHWETLAAGSEYTATASVALPNAAVGNYYLLAKTDTSEKLYESNENNNIFSRLISVGVPPSLPNPANLIITASSIEAQLTWEPIPDISTLQYYAVYMHSASFSNVSGMPRVLTTTQTQANVTGLQPNTTYYFAVTSVDTSGSERKEVTAVVVTTSADNQGPALTNIKWDNSAFTGGQTLIHPGEFAIDAADLSGISKVEFYIDGNLYKTDTDVPYSFYWNIAKETDGVHTLKIIGSDSFANSTTLEYNANIALAPPLAPGITHPVSGQATNNSSIAVTGAAEPESEVVFYNNNIDTVVKTAADKTGNFEITLPLTVGENKIQAAAKNRAGIGSRTAEIIVTYNNTVPNPPRQVLAESKETGAVKISWLVPLGTTAKGYNVYRASNTFSNKIEAVKINTDLIASAFTTDLPQEEGAYYYRATAVSDAGNESDLSNEVIGISDNTPPKAVSIAYTPKGNYDPVTGTMSPGAVDVVLTVSEKLQSTPFLSITPQNASPIPIELSHSESPLGDEESHPQYKGTFTISNTTSSGTAYAVFSARDIAGNRGTEILEGRTIKVDTQGPSIIDLKIEPKSPVKNDTVNPANITVTIGLDEQVKNGEIPQFSYKLSAAGRTFQTISINEIAALPGHTETWQGTFVLPSDAGLNEVETLEFSYSASDSLGNTSTTIKPLNQFQVYQNNLPPLEIPANFKGVSLPQGKIKLSWDKVMGALDYQVYRQAPSESGLAAYARTGDVAEYTDQPAVEGTYLYAIASVRKENNQEAVSAMSGSISLTSDATAPQPPKNLSLELTGSGIKAQWQPPDSVEAVTYSLYRANTDTITSVEGLTAILKGISQLTAIDTNPSQSDHAYVVTAVDAAGNESLPSNSFYLNFELLPVSGISVTQTDNTAPVINWSHPGANISGYNIYLGDQGNKVKLNPSLLINATYIDAGYTQNEREYTVNAVDNNSVESISRSISLPKIQATLKDKSEIKRGLINRVEFSVQNQSAKRIDNLQLKAKLHTYSHTSETFSIEANETKIVPVVIGGYLDIPDTADFITAIEITPNPGEKVEIIRNSQIEVKAGVLVAAIQNEEFIRGGGGKVSFTLQNTGNEEIEVITAQGGKASAEIRFLLIDVDGNFLAVEPFKQQLGEGVITLTDGTTVARIKPNAIFNSGVITIPVPQNAPDKVFVRLEIAKAHYQLGQNTHVEIAGVSTSKELTLINTSYYGQITGVLPQESRGAEDITITGKAVNRSTSQPLAFVPLKLVITLQGFERKSDVYTDAAGAFSYKFKPQIGESGVYKVCVIHPDLLDRPNQAQFVIKGLQITPAQVNLSIPRNYEHTGIIAVTAGEGTNVNNLRLVYEAVDQADGKLAAGVHVTFEPAIPGLGSLQSVNLNFKIWADNNAADSGTVVLKLKSDETPTDSWGTITLNSQFGQAVPVLNFSPNYVETGVKFGDVATETVTLENKGFADLRDVKLSLVLADGAPAPAWVTLNVASELGNITVGAKKDVVISFAPKQGVVPEGIHPFKLRVASSNYQLTDINLFVTVTNSSVGSLFFKVSDIFTGTLDAGNQPIQGLSGASITIQNDLVSSIQQTKASDNKGEALFTDLPSGSYKYWVTADKHSQQNGRIWVKPGLTVTESIFLSYDLVKVEWSVRETTIQDKYEIILNATYETDVPAPVIIAEPKSFTLPDIQVGDVFNAEVRFTNYGLIRADNITLNIPLDDQYFDYSVLTTIPKSIEAKQSVVVPVRLVCKKSLNPSSGQSTGGGCTTYTNCIQMGYSWVCVNGVWQQQAEYACFTDVVGVCEGGGTGIGWGPGGGGGSYTSYSGSASSGSMPLQDTFCAGTEKSCETGDQCCKDKEPQSQEVGSLVSLVARSYEDDVTDMSIKASGSPVDVIRRYHDNAWYFDSESRNLEFIYGVDPVVPDFIKKEGVKYVKTDSSGTVYSFGSTRFIFVKEGGGYRWQDKTGKWNEYDAKGKLLNYGNRNNVKVTLIYEPGENGRLIGVKDNNDRQVLWYEYNAEGKLFRARDISDRKIEYYYENTRLSKVVDVLGNAAQYFYDEQGRLSKQIYVSGLTKDIAYNEYGYVKSVIYGNGKGIFFDYAYNAGKQEYYSRVLFTSGKTIERWYDRLGRKIRTVINGIETEQVLFDGRNKTIIDAAGNQTLQEYDEWGNLIKKTNPDGTSVSYEYEPVFQNVTKMVNEKGVVATYTYDGQGNLVKTVEAVGTDCERTTGYIYDSQGNPTSATDPLGHKVAYEYDINANLVKITDALGNATTYTYDSRGNRINQADANGNTTKYNYDSADRVIGVTDALDHTITYAYDTNGNNISVTYPDGNAKAFVYDEYNRLTRVIARTASEAKQDEAIYTYDSEDKLLTTTDANGNITTYAYDNMGRMSKVTDSQCSITVYSYDIVGNLVNITDAEGHSTSNAYDNLGRLTKITDPLGFVTHYSYDASGSLIRKTDANNQTTEYEYDLSNRLTKIFYGGKINAVKTVNFSYNKLGNMLAWDDGVYSAAQSYDELNRVNNVTTTYPFGAKTISYTYDKVGNRTRVIAPTGVIASPPQAGEAIYTYDSLNRLISVNSGMSTVNYSYDNMSRLIKKILPNGVYTDYTYDNLSRLTSLVNKKSSEEVISNFAYTHDRVGNRLSMATVEGAHNYVYDDIYRLTNASHPIGSPESYTYDRVGNRKTSREYPTWNYDANNRLTSFNGTTFSYDNNGNTIAKTGTTETTNYTYDYENRLSRVIAVSDGDSGVIASPPQAGEAIYTYDPFGKRLSKTVNGVTKYYFYDNEDIIAEYDNSGNLIASYVHGQGIDEPISMTRANNTYYYTFDGLGSVSELTDASQNIVETYKYDSFGNLQIPPATGNPYTYASREYDIETGLYFYRARYYDANVGRFLTSDPIRFEGGVNFYAYVTSNPINLIDPTGLIVYECYKAIVLPIEHVYIKVKGKCEKYNGTWGFNPDWRSANITEVLSGRPVRGRVTHDIGGYCVAKNSDDSKDKCVSETATRASGYMSYYSFYKFNCYHWATQVFSKCGVSATNFAH